MVANIFVGLFNRNPKEGIMESLMRKIKDCWNLALFSVRAFLSLIIRVELELAGISVHFMRCL